jgi:hypothetical protein
VKYQPQVTFSAQAITFRALMNMYEKVVDSVDDPIDYLPIVVFTAFSIEAYVNSIGARNIAIWDQIERNPWKEKIKLLHKNVGAIANWNSNPLLFATQVFEIRDRIAHGKPETVSGPLCDDTNTASAILNVQHIKPTLLKNLTKEWVLDSGEQLYALLKYIGSLYKLNSDDFTIYSSSKIERHGVEQTET